MKELLKKHFQITLRLDDAKYTFEYDQATMRETIEFMNQAQRPDFNAFEWLYSLMVGDGGLSKETFLLLMIDMEKIFEVVKNTRFRGAFEKAKNVAENSGAPFSAYLVLLAKELSLDPMSIIDRYTFEGVKFLTDGIVWNLNEQSDEGRRKNRLKSAMEEVRSEHSDDVSDILEFEKRLLSKQMLEGQQQKK